jgi:long-chain acyl-CoA synthetase
VTDSLVNLADTVRRAAARTPQAPALLFQNQRLTWAELDAAIDATAAGLRALELPATDGVPARVVIGLPNVPEFAVAYFATLRAGLVAVPLNPGYTTRELRHHLADSAASLLVASSAVLEAVSPVRADLAHLAAAYTPGPAPDGSDWVRDFAELARTGERVETTAGGEDLAVLLYTSGTVGVPKGAMLTHRALLANHEQLARITPPIVDADDVVLLALPLFHSYGLQPGLGAVAYHGACGVLEERFDASDSLRLIAQHAITVVAAVPQMYLAWSLLPDMAEQFASVRVAISGAAPLDPAAAGRFLEATGQVVVQGYGLTETAPVVTSGLASPRPKPASIGRPIPGVQVRLATADGGDAAEPDDEDDGNDGDPGEIVVRGDNLFSGYWPDGRDGPDEQGWWATGDIAYADADGDLYLVDRLGELILVSGFNVYPHEIELVLAAYPGVLEAAVIGVPDPYTGQAVKAFVVLAPDTRATSEDLARHCERNLARFKCPSAFEFVDELPHSATGKVRKTTLAGP